MARCKSLGSLKCFLRHTPNYQRACLSKAPSASGDFSSWIPLRVGMRTTLVEAGGEGCPFSLFTPGLCLYQPSAWSEKTSFLLLPIFIKLIILYFIKEKRKGMKTEEKEDSAKKKKKKKGEKKVIQCCLLLLTPPIRTNMGIKCSPPNFLTLINIVVKQICKVPVWSDLMSSCLCFGFIRRSILAD